ncbi:DUF4382 domain-containing protein [Limibacter armeniacum]|uniref:DUF4382 domain-containing protein n=1 Tax=Limibacter armeniacum TaxID=466084 RepID=UPI002FE5F972
MKKHIIRVVSIFGLAALAACTSSKKEENASPLNDKVRLNVILVDAPANYDEVNIDIQDVMVDYTTYSETSTEENWVSLDQMNPNIYNLLELTAGAEAMLGDIEFPAGHLNNVRLILGDSNTVIIDNKKHHLTTPSGQTSGLKVKVDAEMNPGLAYTLTLDFDANRSIVEAGNSGKYNLKPVIRASMDAYGGSVTGIVNPVEESFRVEVLAGETVVAGTETNDGQFLLKGIEAGAYSLAVVPFEGSIYVADTTDIIIVDQEINTLEPITLIEMETEETSDDTTTEEGDNTDTEESSN